MTSKQFRAAREEPVLTQGQLAQALDISRITIDMKMTTQESPGLLSMPWSTCSISEWIHRYKKTGPGYALTGTRARG